MKTIFLMMLLVTVQKCFSQKEYSYPIYCDTLLNNDLLEFHNNNTDLSKKLKLKIITNDSLLTLLKIPNIDQYIITKTHGKETQGTNCQINDRKLIIDNTEIPFDNIKMLTIIGKKQKTYRIQDSFFAFCYSSLAISFLGYIWEGFDYLTGDSFIWWKPLAAAGIGGTVVFTVTMFKYSNEPIHAIQFNAIKQ